LLIVGTAMLAIAGTATAATHNINLYGASAQFSYWQISIGDYLANVAGADAGSVFSSLSNDGKHLIVKATFGGGADTVYMRYSNKASFDGILALEDNDGSAYVSPAVAQCPGQSNYRLMLDETACTWTAWPAAAPKGSCGATATKCVPVTLAASDVAASSFQEKSWGATNGPQGGGVLTWANRNFSGLSTTVPNVLSSQNPIIVPYGFFANNSIKRSNDYPVGGPAPVPADAGWQTISNISRLMGVNIFSGLVTSWKDFGDDFLVVDNTNTEVAGDPIVPCLRHAGSGSHATLDFSVIKGNGWGGTLITKAAANGGKGYFNDGTSQELACINGVSGFNGYGAIGYADADSPIGAANSLPNVVALTYQGEAPSRVNIRNGRYDFWTLEWLYYDATNTDFTDPINNPIITGLEAYANDPTKLTSIIGPPKSNFYSTPKEMKEVKTDTTYPTRQVPLVPQLP